jgi:hypothetical protein
MNIVRIFRLKDLELADMGFGMTFLRSLTTGAQDLLRFDFPTAGPFWRVAPFH